MKYYLILFASSIILIEQVQKCSGTGHSLHTPITKIKLPKRVHDVSYKGIAAENLKEISSFPSFTVSNFFFNSGTVFSYTTSNNRDSLKPIRDYVLESESIKELEENFIAHMTDTILSKLSAEIKSGIPSMSIPPLDPLRLKAIRVDPNFGSDKFTIHLNNIEVYGLSEVDVQDLRPRLNALKVRIALLFPKITANCHFSVNGSLYNVVDVNGEGQANLEYTDVLVRTQLNLVHENKTFQVKSGDPPLVDFGSSRIHLNKNGNSDKTSEIGLASELGPLLFWVFADHIVQEIDHYLLKYINNNMLLFKVPESFNPPVTWLMNRNGIINQFSSQPFPFNRFSPFPFLNQMINSFSSIKPQMNVQATRFFK